MGTTVLTPEVSSGNGETTHAHNDDPNASAVPQAPTDFSVGWDDGAKGDFTFHGFLHFNTDDIPNNAQIDGVKISLTSVGNPTVNGTWVISGALCNPSQTDAGANAEWAQANPNDGFITSNYAAGDELPLYQRNKGATTHAETLYDGIAFNTTWTTPSGVGVDASLAEGTQSGAHAMTGMVAQLQAYMGDSAIQALRDQNGANKGIPFALQLWRTETSPTATDDRFSVFGALDNATAAYRPSITVDWTETNNDPVVAITSPSEGDVFNADVTVELAGTASDEDEPTLDEDDIVWSSDVDGALGTGSPLTVGPLTIGAHVITATVTDEEDASATDTVNITVNNNYTPSVGTPEEIISDNPAYDPKWVCDRCDRSCKTEEMKREYVNNIFTGWYMCGDCWDRDHPQNHLDDVDISDPQGLRLQRIDTDTGEGTTPAVTDLAATPGEANITLTWTDEWDGDLGYQVERSEDGGTVWATLTSLTSGTTSYVDTGIESLGEYVYRVRPGNFGFFYGLSNEASATAWELVYVEFIRPMTASFWALVRSTESYAGGIGTFTDTTPSTFGVAYTSLQTYGVTGEIYKNVDIAYVADDNPPNDPGEDVYSAYMAYYRDDEVKVSSIGAHAVRKEVTGNTTVVVTFDKNDDPDWYGTIDAFYMTRTLSGNPGSWSCAYVRFYDNGTWNAP